MNSVKKLRQAIRLVTYLTLQVVIARSIVLYQTAFCFVYVGFLLLAPWRPGQLSWSLLLGFGVGLVVDLFYDSLGLHALACVLLVYSKAFLVSILSPAGSYEPNAVLTLKQLNWRSFLIATWLLILMHHGALFYLDAWDSALWWVNLRKTVSSALLTYVAFLLVHGISSAK